MISTSGLGTSTNIGVQLRLDFTGKVISEGNYSTIDWDGTYWEKASFLGSRNLFLITPTIFVQLSFNFPF